jgi:hypothetical protein
MIMQQTFTPLWNGPENGQRSYFPPLGPHHSQQYHCLFLEVKIITPNIHSDVSIRQANGASNSDQRE